MYGRRPVRGSIQDGRADGHERGSRRRCPARAHTGELGNLVEVGAEHRRARAGRSIREPVQWAETAGRGSRRRKRPGRGHDGHQLDQDVRNPQRLGDEWRREHLRVGDEHVGSVVERLACRFDNHRAHHGADSRPEGAHRSQRGDPLIFDQATEVDAHADHIHAAQVGARVVRCHESNGMAVGARPTCQSGERFDVAPRPGRDQQDSHRSCPFFRPPTKRPWL